jgi:aminopeptidase N
VWLNEGFATYGEWLWTEHVGGPSADASARRVHDSLAENAAVLPGDPGADHLFDEQAVYLRPAVMLEAVRTTVGDDNFFTILKTFTSRFAGKNASTKDFVAVANEVSKQDLTSLFDAWLYQPALPPLPS